VKNARGHAFFEYGEPMLEKPEFVGVAPLPLMIARTARIIRRCPVNGTLARSRQPNDDAVVTGQDLDGPWIVVQEGVYRYSVTQAGGGMLVRSVMSEYLATEVYWVV